MSVTYTLVLRCIRCIRCYWRACVLREIRILLRLIGKKRTARVFRERGRPTGNKKLKVINKPFTYELCEFRNNYAINLFGRGFFFLLANCLWDRPKKSYSNELFVHAYGTTGKHAHDRRDFFFNKSHRWSLAMTSSSGWKQDVFGKLEFEAKKRKQISVTLIFEKIKSFFRESPSVY